MARIEELPKYVTWGSDGEPCEETDMRSEAEKILGYVPPDTNSGYVVKVPEHGQNK